MGLLVHLFFYIIYSVFKALERVNFIGIGRKGKDPAGLGRGLFKKRFCDK